MIYVFVLGPRLPHLPRGQFDSPDPFAANLKRCSILDTYCRLRERDMIWVKTKEIYSCVKHFTTLCASYILEKVLYTKVGHWFFSTVRMQKPLTYLYSQHEIWSYRCSYFMKVHNDSRSYDLTGHACRKWLLNRPHVLVYRGRDLKNKCIRGEN